MNKSENNLLEEELLKIEKGLWTNNADLYKDSLVPEALLVFAETGVIDRETAVNAIMQENKTGRKWAEAAFEDVKLLKIDSDTAILNYTSKSRWANDEKINKALATSIYVRRKEGWKLILHQQTAIDK